MTSILNGLKGEKHGFLLQGKKKKKSGNTIALFYVSRIRNHIFITAVLLYCKVLAIKPR